ncbi:hypothetical protein RRG08_057472 [Elysia crispata]|uniref:Uncharacterized protein n=1 Tax=Elysia crispata TaxID=231223 RepID=A0AAE1B4N9_9GAST|nr:hypothetical protein RRG08_057472 [Elysia crispata]
MTRLHNQQWCNEISQTSTGIRTGEKSLLVRLGSYQVETFDNRVHRAIFINVFGDMLPNTDIKYCYELIQTGDPAKVNGTRADKTVTLSFSQASDSYLREAVQGFFLEESTTCTCSLSYDCYHSGTAQWYKRDSVEVESTSDTINFCDNNKNNRAQDSYYLKNEIFSPGKRSP